MHTIAILSQKGGAGKTTLALNLAVAAEMASRSAVVVDLDPQASAKTWHDHRSADQPVVISMQAARLPDALQVAQRHGASTVIIDTAPHSESAALAAARVADLVLIPCRPGILDLRAITASVDICKLAKARAAAVLNGVPARGRLSSEAVDAIGQYGISVAPAHLGQRIAFVHSLTAAQGVLEYEPEGKASQEVKSLYMWVCEHVDILTC